MNDPCELLAAQAEEIAETYYHRCKADDMTWPCATVQKISVALEAPEC